MRFHQVKELVDWAAGYHRRLAEQYTALAGGGGVDERVRLPECLDCESVQSVLATALTAHRTLQDLYTHRAELAGGSDEKTFFEALGAGHEAEVRRIARDMQRLEDY